MYYAKEKEGAEMKLKGAIGIGSGSSRGGDRRVAIEAPAGARVPAKATPTERYWGIAGTAISRAIPQLHAPSPGRAPDGIRA